MAAISWVREQAQDNMKALFFCDHNEAVEGKCVIFKILVYAFGESWTELSDAKCERNTVGHCLEGRRASGGRERQGEHVESSQRREARFF